MESCSKSFLQSPGREGCGRGKHQLLKLCLLAQSRESNTERMNVIPCLFRSELRLTMRDLMLKWRRKLKNLKSLKTGEPNVSLQRDRCRIFLVTVINETVACLSCHSGRETERRLQASCLNRNMKGRCSRQARNTGCETSLPNTPYTAFTVAALDQAGSLKSEQRKRGHGAELLVDALIPLAAPIQA